MLVKLSDRTSAFSALLCCFARLLPQCIGHTFWLQASLAPRIASDCVGSMGEPVHTAKSIERIFLYEQALEPF